MTTLLPLTDITRSAIHILCQELGVINTARFLNQFSLGYGNYTTERDQFLEDLTVDEIAEEIYASQKSDQKAA